MIERRGTVHPRIHVLLKERMKELAKDEKQIRVVNGKKNIQVRFKMYELRRVKLNFKSGSLKQVLDYLHMHHGLTEMKDEGEGGFESFKIPVSGEWVSLNFNSELMQIKFLKSIGYDYITAEKKKQAEKDARKLAIKNGALTLPAFKKKLEDRCPSDWKISDQTSYKHNGGLLVLKNKLNNKEIIFKSEEFIDDKVFTQAFRYILRHYRRAQL